MSSESQKQSQAQWMADYGEFLSTPPQAPPAHLSSAIREQVRARLFVSPIKVFVKLALIHFVVGGLTLLFCPQFGVGAFRGMGLMGFYMQFGIHFCTFACGATFLGISGLVSSMVLSKAELEVARPHRLWQFLALALISLGVFGTFGELGPLTHSLSWVGGSLLGALLLLEAGGRVRGVLKTAEGHLSR